METHLDDLFYTQCLLLKRKRSEGTKHLKLSVCFESSVINTLGYFVSVNEEFHFANYNKVRAYLYAKLGKAQD